MFLRVVTGETICRTIMSVLYVEYWMVESHARTITDGFWWATWVIRSRLLISGERPEQIAHGRSFLVSDLSDLLSSLIFGERPEQFAHIAH